MCEEDELVFLRDVAGSSFVFCEDCVEMPPEDSVPFEARVNFPPAKAMQTLSGGAVLTKQEDGWRVRLVLHACLPFWAEVIVTAQHVATAQDKGIVTIPCRGSLADGPWNIHAQLYQDGHLIFLPIPLKDLETPDCWAKMQLPPA
jgi:hypothetical protein